MISSILLSAFLTVAFLVTGGYALLRWASLRAGVAGHHGDQIAEPCHLLMSLAMIGMVYGYAGPVVDVVQIVGFGAFALYFLLRWVDGRRARPSAAHGCRGAAHHFVMSAAMVWMVAAMPLLMGPMTSGSAGGHAGHAGHGGSDMGTSMTMPAAPAPAWALAVSWVVIALLVVGAGFWARESLLAPVSSPDRAPALVGAGVADDVPGPGASHPVARALTPRTDAACHCLMSLAMALGFLPML